MKISQVTTTYAAFTPRQQFRAQQLLAALRREQRRARSCAYVPGCEQRFLPAGLR